MTPEEVKAEIQKCKESPFYFYDKYIILPNGEEKMKEKEFNDKWNMLKLSLRKTCYDKI